MNKKQLELVVGSAGLIFLVTMVVYAVGLIATLNLNPMAWNYWVRAVLGTLWLCSMAFVVACGGYCFEEYEDEE